MSFSNPTRGSAYLAAVLNRKWYVFSNATVGGNTAFYVDIYRPTDLNIKLYGPSPSSIPNSSIDRELGGSDTVADYLVNSHGKIEVTFEESGVKVTPNSSNVQVLDFRGASKQNGSSTTLSVGVEEYLVLPATFYAPGCFIIRWTAIMPSGFQVMFDVPVTVDREV